MFIPPTMLKQLYTIGSLHEHEGGIVFTLKNRLKDTVINEISCLSINQAVIEPKNIHLQFEQGKHLDGIELNKVTSFEKVC